MVASKEFKELNAVVHAVTAEDGRDPSATDKKSNECGSEIEARLAVRGVTELGFKVHSDPEHTLLMRGPDGNVSGSYIIETLDTSKFQRCISQSRTANQKNTTFFICVACNSTPPPSSQTSVPYINYEMVQPAMTVIKKGGDIQQGRVDTN